MENFNENVHQVPANYTDSGKMLGGLVSPRNLIEAILIALALGYVEIALIPMTLSCSGNGYLRELYGIHFQNPRQPKTCVYRLCHYRRIGGCRHRSIRDFEEA